MSHYNGGSRVRVLHHDFARAIEQQDAKLSQIQRRLGHKSATTTTIYVEALVRNLGMA